MPILKGRDLTEWGEDAVFSDQEETRVIRTAKWVLFKRYGCDDERLIDELYDVETDPKETNNLAADPAHAETKAILEHSLENFFAKYADDNADLWKGGMPIQHSERKQFWRDAWGDEWKPVYTYDNH